MGIAFGIIGICLSVAIPVLIIVAIIRGLTKKDSNGESDVHGFERVIRNIYIYIILITSFCMMIIGVIGAFNTGLNVLLPEEDEYTYTSYYGRSYSNINEDKRSCVAFATTAIVGVPLFVCHSKYANKMNKKSKAEKSKEVTKA